MVNVSVKVSIKFLHCTNTQCQETEATPTQVFLPVRDQEAFPLTSLQSSTSLRRTYCPCLRDSLANQSRTHICGVQGLVSITGELGKTWISWMMNQ